MLTALAVMLALVAPSPYDARTPAYMPEIVVHKNVDRPRIARAVVKRAFRYWHKRGYNLKHCDKYYVSEGNGPGIARAGYKQCWMQVDKNWPWHRVVWSCAVATHEVGHSNDIAHRPWGIMKGTITIHDAPPVCKQIATELDRRRKG